MPGRSPAFLAQTTIETGIYSGADRYSGRVCRARRCVVHHPGMRCRFSSTGSTRSPEAEEVPRRQDVRWPADGRCTQSIRRTSRVALPVGPRMAQVSSLKARAVGLGSWHRGREPWRRSEIPDTATCAFHSARRAFMTSMRAARRAGTEDATIAAVSSTDAERTTGKAPGIFTSRK